MVHAVDKIEVFTLQDNYIDLTVDDSSEIVQRVKDIENKKKLFKGILAEHGLSTLVTTIRGSDRRSLLFDFGFSAFGAAFNAEVFNIDLESVECMALSHGHFDHTGGLAAMSAAIGKPGIKLVLHPGAVNKRRFTKVKGKPRQYRPPFTDKMIEDAGVVAVKTDKPYSLLDDTVLFLGEIPRLSVFEKVDSSRCYEEKGVEKYDTIADDSAVVCILKDKGLVVLTGCAHAGVVNTVRHAQKVTGVNKVHAIMGGFHLTGVDRKKVLEPTISNLKELAPDFIIPTHCTGRKETMQIEKELPEAFILNMVGTKLTFAATS
jgi:7,8-dihydropterin-6-yl-methyl-4-(beta-D-ribofuranosyl)aminobenzene 5'-phosphate synthase